MPISDDFKELLPKRAKQEPDHRPIEILWVFDPQDGKVHIENGKHKHPAHFPTHETMAPDVTHPDRQEGYAYSIEGGWRITDADHHKLEDPFVLRRVRAALQNQHPPAPLPHVRYHGDVR